MQAGANNVATLLIGRIVGGFAVGYVGVLDRTRKPVIAEEKLFKYTFYDGPSL